MEINVNDILTGLNRLEKCRICLVCSKTMVNPLLIKTCGHYFCQDCLMKRKLQNNCPKCNQFYSSEELDHSNLMTQRSVLNILNDLKKVLSSQEYRIDESFVKKNKCETTSNGFMYENNKYHLNFVDTLPLKLNAKGESQLHVACRRKKIDEVKKLIANKVDLNIKDYAGWSPLHEAVESNSPEIVDVLLKNGALVNIPGVDYVTPLHKAVLLENEPVISSLLNFGADPNATDYNGLKPFDITKNTRIKNLLLKNSKTGSGMTYELFLPNKLKAYCHSIDEEFKNKLAVSKNIHVHTDMDYRKKITHFFIKKTHKLSFKILCAMLQGLQFVPQDLVDNYVKGEYFIDIPNYTFILHKDLNLGIQRSMLSSLLKLPKLFEGINFYIENHNKKIEVFNLKTDKDYLVKIIQHGGGHVLHRPPALRTCSENFTHPYYSEEHCSTYRCCNYIIYEKQNPPRLKYNMPELLHKSSEWLISCIINFKITD